MKEQPLVSVIIPAFNAQNYLIDAVDSIKNQTYTNLEIIIIDDGSTDNTYVVAQKLTQGDARVVLYKNEKNMYIAKTRNKAIMLCKGKYIVWQDADDISQPQRIMHQVEFMETHADVGICGGFLQSFDSSGDLDVRTYAADDSPLRKNIFRFSPVAQPAAIVRRECFDKVGLFDENFPPAEDLDMSFRIGQYYKFANLQEIVIRYREHEKSNTVEKMSRMLSLTLQIRKKYSNSHGYKMSKVDNLAYFVTYLMQLVDPWFTITLFKFFRKVLFL